jgi:regulator of replication initiation timing
LYAKKPKGRKKKNMDYPEIKTPNKRNNLIVIILTTLLIILTILYFQQKSEHNSIQRQLTVEKDSIAAELSRMVVGYNSIKTENDTLNKSIIESRTKVDELLKEVEHVKNVSYAEIKKYKDEATTLRGIMRSFVAQIDSLNQRNKQLMDENVSVKQQVVEVKTVNQQLEQEKKKLQQTVSLAAQLEASGLKAIGISSKGKEQQKANKIEKFKIDFTLGKNLTAKRGSKNVYVRIQRPDQILLMKSDKDVFSYENMKIPYSASREIEYEGNDLPVSIYYDVTNELIPGKYTIDVFADGSNIGTTALEVR